jgi:hypothetical protein
VLISWDLVWFKIPRKISIVLCLSSPDSPVCTGHCTVQCPVHRLGERGSATVRHCPVGHRILTAPNNHCSLSGVPVTRFKKTFVYLSPRPGSILTRAAQALLPLLSAFPPPPCPCRRRSPRPSSGVLSLPVLISFPSLVSCFLRAPRGG